jgi:zinc/manganese transport system ATP-binding protein
MKNAIELQEVTLRYGHVTALSGVCGVFHAGSLTAVAGPNGAGKSSLLKLIAGTVKPASGRVVLSDEVRGSVAYLPQAADLAHDFPFSVEQAVGSGLWKRLGEKAEIGKAEKEKIRAALSEVGMEGFEKRQIAALSGGQFQRMLFARLIVQDAALILLDEPFAAIDAETTENLIRILLKWHGEGRTIVCVLHDLLMIRKYFPDSFVLSGKCLGHGHTHKLLERNLFSFDLDMAELCPGTDCKEHCHHDHV